MQHRALPRQVGFAISEKMAEFFEMVKSYMQKVCDFSQVTELQSGY
jgi:hypothetical protein